ncbi:restriction endonuclease subunit S [uncultured Maribacter sp.]|uniref:restriction endonuclease subunit S n=1 Tax=uncultured Maribacter sp. TaxID=431308 RepID=UPI0026366C56|nr:restriction endonuclease subunit S [uncultured Maribacter sp.]
MEENQKHIPEGWKLTSFDNKDFFRIIGSGIKHFKGEKEYYSTSSIDGNRILFAEQLITYKNRPSRANMQPIENSVWFAKMKNTFKILKATKREIEEVILSTGFSGIESTIVDCDYLMQILSSAEFNSQKNLLAEGSTQEAVNNTKIKEIKFLLPEKPKEQTQIATILTKVDEAITQTEQLIAKYTRIKTGLIQDLLTKGIDENGNIRSEENHEFKDSPLGRIPKEWEYKTLGDNNIIELHNNKRKPISSKDRANMIGDYPYYGATGIIDMLNVFRVDGEFVLFGEDGDHFLKWVYQEQTILTNGKFNVSNHAHIVKGTSKCSTKWIHYFFCHRDITFYLTRQGAGRFKLNKASLLSLPILLPKSKNEQNAIIDRIEKVNEYSDNLNLRLIKLQSLKTGLMQDLLSGKVRVQLIKETANV